MKYCFLSVADDIPNIESPKIHSIVYPPVGFMDYIVKHEKIFILDKKTTANNLRTIIADIVDAYCEKVEFNVYLHLPVHQYTDVKFQTNQDLFNIIIRIFNNHFPAIYDRYLSYQLKNLPKGTTLIYLINAPLRVENVMAKSGIEKLSPSFIRDYVEDVHYKPGIETGAYAPTKENLEAHKKMMENKLLGSLEMEAEMDKIAQQLKELNPEHAQKLDKLTTRRENNRPKPLKEALHGKQENELSKGSNNEKSESSEPSQGDGK